MIKAILYQTSKRRSWNFVICALMMFILFNRYKTFTLAHPNQVFGSRFCIFFSMARCKKWSHHYHMMMWWLSAMCFVFYSCIEWGWTVPHSSAALSRRSVKYIRLAAAHDRDCRWIRDGTLGALCRSVALCGARAIFGRGLDASLPRNARMKFRVGLSMQAHDGHFNLMRLFTPESLCTSYVEHLQFFEYYLMRYFC